jgi:flagellar M-ring protein FliF
LAAEAKLAADALAAAEAKAREEAMIAEAKAREEALQAELAAKLAEAEAAAHAAAQTAAAEGEQVADQDIEIEEGETLEEVKARMASLKPKKQSISADLLNTANSYDDKVALIRMIVAEDSTRVAGVLKSLIQ